MKIALIGYGNMGKMIEQAALARGHLITIIPRSAFPASPKFDAELKQTDICIDFSHPCCAIEHLERLAHLGKNLVMGTTGWDADFDKVKQIVEMSNIGFLYSPNFSIGVALFHQILIETVELVAPFEAYDVSGIEIHHNKKADSPSGTALAITSSLNKHLIPQKKKIQFSSVRVGATPGTHSVIFDSDSDTITLTHTARNRKGFAEGALTAAEWLIGKKGMFTLEDMLVIQKSQNPSHKSD